MSLLFYEQGHFFYAYICLGFVIDNLSKIEYQSGLMEGKYVFLPMFRG